jgi:hypothetical protein
MRLLDLNTHINEVHDDTAILPAVRLAELRVPHEWHNTSATGESSGTEWIPERRFKAIQQMDTGEVVAVVSDRYNLVQHQDILTTVKDAFKSLDVGKVPYGIYTYGRGAKMDAIFKFPELAKAINGQDRLCPMIRVSNSYDASSRIRMELGAFRFVCTNFSIGGTGLFTGGFRAIHLGYHELSRFANGAEHFLGKFDEVMDTYRGWAETKLTDDKATEFLNRVCDTRWPLNHFVAMKKPFIGEKTVFDAYNGCTHYATHGTRSSRIAFDLLAWTNQTFAEVVGKKGV